MTGNVARLDPEGHRGVKDAGAVEVLGEAELVGERFRLGKVVEREYLAALGVLEAEEPTSGVVEVVPGLDHRPHCVEGKGPIPGEVDGLGLDPAECGGSACLGTVAVGTLPGDELVAAAAVGEEGEEVALGAA